MELVGGMMLLVGIQLGKGAVKLRGWGLGLALATAVVSLATNMVVGFLAGLSLAYLVRAIKHSGKLPCLCSKEEVTPNV